MNRNKGFTVIELMAVIAIVSILAVIILAVYADYVVRSKVTEGMAFVAEAKTSVSEYYYNVKVMPDGNQQAGLSDPDAYDVHKYVSRLEIATQPRPGTIVVTFKIEGSKADGKELWMVPSTRDQTVSWRCFPPTDNGIDINQVPPNCRGE